jgi:hypothetical protein
MQTWETRQAGADLSAEAGRSRCWRTRDVTWGRPIFRAPELPSGRPARYELAPGQQFFGRSERKTVLV